MEDSLKIKMSAFTLDCKDAHALAEFYTRLLHWEIPYFDQEYAVLSAPGTAQGAYPAITFQQNPDYLPPVWPDEPSKQQQMAHIDFAVNDLAQAVSYSIACGAKIASEQFSELWTVMLDPEGHPFCLCLMKQAFESPQFGLL